MMGESMARRIAGAVPRWMLVGACAVLIIGSAGAASAESIFSSLGLGESLLPATARGRGMGGTGISVADTVSSSFLNPATASLLHRVTLSAVYTPEVRYPAGPRGTSRNWSSRISALALVFPLPRGVALSLGLMVRGNMNSEVTTSGRAESSPYRCTSR